MAKRRNRFPHHFGHREVDLSRYVVLYTAQIAWLALGAYLYFGAFWPSTCTPHTLFEVYGCSMLLPESGGWKEGCLLTWLWSTPILVVMEVLRRLGYGEE